MMSMRRRAKARREERQHLRRCRALVEAAKRRVI